MNPIIIDLGEKVLQGGEITFEEALKLEKINGSDVYFLLAYANRIREKFTGDRVEICSIINAKSGGCSEDCAFCAQSAFHHADIMVYDLLDEEVILNKAKAMEAAGAHHFDLVIQGYGISHNDPQFKKIIKIYERLRKETNLKLCASLGILTPEAAKALKDAGVTRYNHNLETSKSFFPKVVTTHTYEDRVATVKIAKEAGMEVCCGGIIGLGESPRNRLELAFALKALQVDSVPINILYPHKGTKLAGQERLSPLEILKTFALFRFVLPDKVIRFAGGREFNLGVLQPLGFLAGLNALIVGGYLTIPGEETSKDLAMLNALGLKY